VTVLGNQQRGDARADAKQSPPDRPGRQLDLAVRSMNRVMDEMEMLLAAKAR